MAELKLNLGIGNLGELSRKLSSLKVGGKEGASGGGVSFGGAVKIGGMVALMTELVRKTAAIQTILDVVAGFLNVLITPFVPILIGLMKPFFVLFQLVGQLLLNWLLKAGVTENKTGTGVGAVVGGVGGAVVGGGFGAIVGTFLGAIFGSLEEMVINFLSKLGGDLIAKTILWIDGIFGTNFKKAFIMIGNGLAKVILGVWKWLKGIFTMNLGLMVQGLYETFMGFVNIFGGILLNLVQPFIVMGGFLWSILTKVWTSLKDIFNSFLKWIFDGFKSFVNILISTLNKIIEWINRISPFKDISKISSIKDKSSAPTINLTVNGDVSSQTTMDNLIKAMRGELNRRGTF